MKLIKKGAEGDLYSTVWYDQKAVLKSRKKKDYRHPKLDLQIRKQRTIRESQIISEVKSFGVGTPLIYQIDPKNSNIIMQYIHGTIVRDLAPSKLIKSCKEIGKLVGLLHKNGFMHGDLTTSNFILHKDRIFVIDFGLATRTKKPDDHAVDLRLFKEILNSAHAKIMEKAWFEFLLGYKSKVGLAYLRKISKLVSIIESRGRYATVV